MSIYINSINKTNDFCNPPSNGGGGGGGSFGGGPDCNICYVPSIKIPIDYSKLNSFNDEFDHDYKGSLYVNSITTKDSNNSREIRVYRREGNQIKEEFFYNLNYDTFQYRVKVTIVDDTTFITQTSKYWSTYDDFTELKLFKKNNGQWSEIKTVNINGLSLEVTDHGLYLFEYIAPKYDRKYYRFNIETNTRTFATSFNTVSGNSYVRLTEKGYAVHKNRGFVIENWIFNNGSYYLANTENLPMHLSYLNNDEEVTFKINGDYAVGGSLIYKKNGSSWVFLQEITGRNTRSFDIDWISNEYIFIDDYGRCSESNFYKMNANGLFEEIRDYNHLIPSYVENAVFLRGNLFKINRDLNEILFSDQILKLSDILQTDDLKVDNYAKDSVILSNVSFINSNRIIIAKTQIILKPESKIISGNVLLKIEPNALDSDFSTTCVLNKRSLMNSIKELEVLSSVKYKSTNNLAKKNIKIDRSILFYPNPNNGVLYIKNYKEVQKINIYDLLGKNVFNKVTIKTNKIKLPRLKEGLYYLVLTTIKGEEITKKLIIKY
jgi:hypothetical protein